MYSLYFFMDQFLTNIVLYKCMTRKITLTICVQLINGFGYFSISLFWFYCEYCPGRPTNGLRTNGSFKLEKNHEKKKLNRKQIARVVFIAFRKLVSTLTFPTFSWPPATCGYRLSRGIPVGRDNEPDWSIPKTIDVCRNWTTPCPGCLESPITPTGYRWWTSTLCSRSKRVFRVFCQSSCKCWAICSENTRDVKRIIIIVLMCCPGRWKSTGDRVTVPICICQTRTENRSTYIGFCPASMATESSKYPGAVWHMKFNIA